MPACVNHTVAFRAQVQELARVHPPDARKGKARQTNAAAANDGFLAEAYAIVSRPLATWNHPSVAADLSSLSHSSPI